MSLEEKVKEFRDEYEITCPESIYQRDTIAVNALQFIESLIEEVGYFKEPTKILVCGGRWYGRSKDDEDPQDPDVQARVEKEIHNFMQVMDDICERFNHTDIVIVQGGAKGADFLGKRYAEWKKFEVEEYKANWGQYGKRAGIIRNQQMLEEADPQLVIAFPGGNGTEHMVKISEESGIEVIRG